MNATPRKAKAVKTAVIVCGAIAALVIGLGALLMVIGLIIASDDDYVAPEPAPASEAAEPEPEPEPTEAAEEPEPTTESEPTKEAEPAPKPEPTEKAEVAPEPTTEPEPVKEEKPEPTKEPEPAPEPEPAKESEPAADEAGVSTERAQQIQSELDVMFDDCAWQDSESGGIVMSVCAEKEIGIIVGPGESSVQGILDAMGEEAHGGGYFYADSTPGSTVAVWGTDTGTVNMAWDAMGAPGTPTQF